MVKSLMEVAITPSISHIEGISVKGSTEGLHCDVLKLFSFTFPVRASSRAFPQNGSFTGNRKSSLKTFIVVIVEFQFLFLRLTL